MDKGRKSLQFLRALVPTKLGTKIEYRIKCKRKLNLKNPKRFSEKIQLYKLNYRNSLLPKLADKDAVRNYVKEKGLEHILNEQYGVYESVEEIDFKKLPKKFVIKLNTGSGFNMLVENKDILDIKETKKTLNKWLKIKPWIFGTEWVYKEIKPKIIIERYLKRDKNNDLPDYKFFAFNGKIKYLYTMVDYIDDHSQGKLGFYDRNFKKTPYHRKDYSPITREIERPKQFEKMLQYAEILSKNLPHVRVDLYNIDGEIVFGELTFYTNGGYINFEPDEFDYILGEEFEYY